MWFRNNATNDNPHQFIVSHSQRVIEVFTYYMQTPYSTEKYSESVIKLFMRVLFTLLSLDNPSERACELTVVDSINLGTLSDGYIKIQYASLSQAEMDQS